MDFCTLGMFIIVTIVDEIHPPPSASNQTPQLDIIGGAGTYSAVGARLVSPPPSSSKVGWIVDCGTDFPVELHQTIANWETGALIRKREGLTTRGWNGYGANEHRAFKYLTPKLRLTAEDLTPELLSSRSFHLISSPLRCIELVNGILERRAKTSPDLARPLFIWEPVPDLCIESELENTYEAIKHLDVISPNHAELASLFGLEATTASGDVNRSGVEECSRKLVSAVSSSDRELHVVVRSGKDGCYVRSSKGPSDGTWIPAYHADNPVKVEDPTGGGNGFLGGFAIGLVKTSDPIQAAVWGSVSASLCIEQVGMPVLERTADGSETWNGVDVQKRLKQFQDSCLRQGR